MKLVMSFAEVAALAGIVKEAREIFNPEAEKETVQHMMSTVMENFKDEEKHSFVTMKLDTSMNLIIDANPEAVIKIIELLKKYFVAAFPMIKLLGETGMKMVEDIQEIVDEYDDEKPVHVTIVNVGNNSSQSKNSDISKSANHFEKMFMDMMKNTEETNKASEGPICSSIPRGPKSTKKKAFICPKCQHTAMIDPKKDHTCRMCGHEMDRMFI